MTNLLSFVFISVVLSIVPASATGTSPHNLRVDLISYCQQVPQDTETNKLLQAAFSLFSQGKFEEALANCSKAIALNPNDYRPHGLSGLIYRAQLKLKEASESLGTAIRLNSGKPFPQLYLLKSEVDGRRGATEEALAGARKALEVDPNLAEAYALIGEALKGDEKRRAEAVSAYRSAIKLKPDLHHAYESLAQLFEEAKDLKSAEETLRQAIAADPEHMRGRFRLGRMLVDQHRLAEARELWEGRTSDEDNSFPQFIELLKRAENLKRANDTLAQRPQDPDALVEMGMAVMEGDHWVVDGRQKRAIVYFKNALKVKPNHARAQYGIVKAYIQIANTFKDENKNVDQELARLRKLDSSLADEMEAYRKRYRGGIVISDAPLSL